MTDKKELTLWMCGVDWQHELGEASGGTSLYGSLEDIKKHRTCTGQCGCVRLKVTLEVEAWDIEQNFSGEE